METKRKKLYALLFLISIGETTSQQQKVNESDGKRILKASKMRYVVRNE